MADDCERFPGDSQSAREVRPPCEVFCPLVVDELAEAPEMTDKQQKVAMKREKQRKNQEKYRKKEKKCKEEMQETIKELKQELKRKDCIIKKKDEEIQALKSLQQKDTQYKCLERYKKKSDILEQKVKSLEEELKKPKSFQQTPVQVPHTVSGNPDFILQQQTSDQMIVPVAGTMPYNRGENRSANLCECAANFPDSTPAGNEVTTPYNNMMGGASGYYNNGMEASGYAPAFPPAQAFQASGAPSMQTSYVHQTFTSDIASGCQQYFQTSTAEQTMSCDWLASQPLQPTVGSPVNPGEFAMMFDSESQNAHSGERSASCPNGNQLNPGRGKLQNWFYDDSMGHNENEEAINLLELLNSEAQMSVDAGGPEDDALPAAEEIEKLIIASVPASHHSG